MNSLQIQYFMEVVKQGSFTEAARVLFVSQPAVSKQIRLLEEEIGYLLFERSRKSAVLTYEGKKVWDYFTQCQFQMELLKSHLEEKRRTGSYPIRISYLEGLDTRYFLEAMEQAAKASGKNLSLELTGYPLSQLFGALSSKKADAILTFGSPLSRENLYAETMAEIPRVILYSAGKFGSSIKEPQQFKNEIFLLPEDEYTPNLEQTLFDLFLHCGYTPKVEYVPNFITIMDRVERGEGVFVYNRWCRQCRQPAFGFLELPFRQTLYLVRREKEAGEELQAFLQSLYKQNFL